MYGKEIGHIISEDIEDIRLGFGSHRPKVSRGTDQMSSDALWSKTLVS